MEQFEAANVGPMFSDPVRQGFLDNIQKIKQAGAELLTGGKAKDGPGFYTENTLLKVSAADYLKNPEAFQQEAFGNSSLLVTTDNVDQMPAIAESVEGQLTGCVYLTDEAGDEAVYDRIEPILRRRVGRLLNNKMPTGVAVSPAMNHGGPYPATGHAGFTAVGLPASIRRFSMLCSYDNVPEHRLPALLK
ncbi:aldehyde dehydrogenase family protein [bacterium]|nr:aldehyde dehydrogenase family protein [bacterium]